MLTHSDRLRGTVVDAQIHTAARASDLRVSRFGIVVDELGNECGAVSDRYTLVRNADLIAAVDLASDDLGLELECAGGIYSMSGRSQYTFYLPGDFKVPGDNSDVRTNITIGNGYGGTHNVDGTGGTYRLVCSNGMSIGTIVSAMKRRHVGEFDLMRLVQEMMVKLVEETTTEKQRAILAAETPFEWNVSKAENEGDAVVRQRNNTLLQTIAKDTPKRYVQGLSDAIKAYRTDVGHTTWAIVQAVGEIAQHDMNHTQAAQNWSRRNQARVMEVVGI